MQLAYVIGVLHNLMDALSWYNEAIEMHVCKLSMGLEKLKFDKTVSKSVFKEKPEMINLTLQYH